MMHVLLNWLNRRQTSKETQRMFESLLSLAWIVEAKDPYTGGHLWRVSQLAHTVALADKWTHEDRAAVTLGGFLHDLGKVSVPDAILCKSGALTDDEFDIIKNHPTEGLYVLEGHPLTPIVKNAVGLHHERIDGRGYPNQLRGDDLPIDAKLIALCDAFDAMTSQRPYRKPMAKETAIELVEKNLDTQFDAALGARFVALARAGNFDTIIAHTDEGIPLHHCPTCGPTITQYSTDKPGQFLHCPICLQQAELIQKDNQYVLKPTGKKIPPAQQRRRPDMALIRKIIHDTIRTIPVQSLLDRANQSNEIKGA